MTIELTPIGHVLGGRKEITDDNWGGVRADIDLDPDRFTPDALLGLDSFSHLVVVYHFHQADPQRTVIGARHPRGNTCWPQVGIFAQRGRDRPNRIGVSHCRLLGIDGLRLHVEGLDAVDGTPVLDLKPYMTGFEPRGEIREPPWAQEIMAGCW